MVKKKEMFNGALWLILLALAMAGCSERENVEISHLGDHPEYVKFEKLTFLSIHPMWGGINIWIDGSLCEIQISGESDTEGSHLNQIYQFHLSEDELGNIKFLLWANEFESIVPGRYQSAHDEGLLVIEIVSESGERTVRSLLGGDIDRWFRSITLYLNSFEYRAKTEEPVESWIEYPFKDREMDGFDTIEEIKNRGWTFLRTSTQDGNE